MPQLFLYDKVYFSFSSLILSNVCSSELRIAVYIAFVSAIVFKFGAWSDFLHYMMQFSTIYSHGLIDEYHENIILVWRIPSLVHIFLFPSILSLLSGLFSVQKNLFVLFVELLKCRISTFDNVEIWSGI